MGTAISSKDEAYRQITEAFGLVPEWVKEMPEVAVGGFWALFRDFYLAETRIPNKYKELIGLAVSGATRCRYCVLFHTEAARLHGASDEEIAEAGMMAGVTMIGSTFLNAEAIDFERFRSETLDIVDHIKQQLAAAPSRTATPGHVEHLGA